MSNTRPRLLAIGTRDERSGFVGYVLRFRVRKSFLDEYPIRIAGNSDHQEYWIPAADLDLLNENLLGTIELVKKFVPNRPKLSPQIRRDKENQA
jgi:hypothetical protein